MIFKAITSWVPNLFLSWLEALLTGELGGRLRFPQARPATDGDLTPLFSVQSTIARFTLDPIPPGRTTTAFTKSKTPARFQSPVSPRC